MTSYDEVSVDFAASAITITVIEFIFMSSFDCFNSNHWLMLQFYCFFQIFSFSKMSFPFHASSLRRYW